VNAFIELPSRSFAASFVMAFHTLTSSSSSSPLDRTLFESYGGNVHNNVSRMIANRVDNLTLLSLGLSSSASPSSSSHSSATHFPWNASNVDQWWLHLFPQTYVDPSISLPDFLFRVFGVVLCFLLIICTLFGNILTVLVVKRFHRMKTVTNILLAR
jgi:hypothetical protein